MREQIQDPKKDFLQTDRGKTKSNAIEIPSLSLPKGGGAIKGPIGQALDAIGEAIGGVIDSIIDLFK